MSNIFDFNVGVTEPLPFWKWNRVLPAVYDDSLSQYELLCKLLYKVNEIITSSNSTGEQVEKLTELVQQLIDGQFPDGLVEYVEGIAEEAVQDDISTIQDAIDALENQVDNSLPFKLPRLNDPNTKLVTIGDSWNAGVCDGHLSGYDIADGWSRRIVSMVGRGTSNYANYGQPSAGFYVKGGTQQRNFYDILDGVTSTDESTIIIVAGGINDSNALNSSDISVNDIQTAAQAFCNHALEKFPNSTIYVFPMLWPGHSTLRASDVRTKDAIIRGCRNSNAMVSICEHTPEFLFGQAAYFGTGTQGHHTTSDGLLQVARYMKEFICGGDAHYQYWSNLRDTSQPTCLTYDYVDVRINDGILSVTIKGDINSNYDSTNVPFFSLRDGNTFFGNRIPKHIITAISGYQCPIMLVASGSDINLASRLGATVEEGETVYIDFSMPFAF